MSESIVAKMQTLQDLQFDIFYRTLCGITNYDTKNYSREYAQTTPRQMTDNSILEAVTVEPWVAQRSTAVTTGFFVTNIIKTIEKGNNLDLSKIQIEKQNIGRGRMAFVHYAKYNG
eukprot:187324_1